MQDYFLICLTAIEYFVPIRFDDIHEAKKHIKINYPNIFRTNEYRFIYCVVLGTPPTLKDKK